MPVSVPCSFSYFDPGNSVAVNSSIGRINISNKVGVPAGYNISAGRPFIPYVGMALDGSGAFKPVTIASNQNNKNTFYDWFKAAWFASNNYVNNNVANKDLILNGDSNFYASYLNKRLASTLQQDRYLQIGSIIWDFWNNADLAWTNAQYQDALQKLLAYIALVADFNLYLAPADYQFLSAAPTPNDSGLGADILAWKTADATLVSFGVIEVYI